MSVLAESYRRGLCGWCGSTIKDDVPKFSLVVGNPQRIVKQYDHENRVLIVAAHPDDEAIGCGGTISNIKNGDSIQMYFRQME